MLSSLFCQLIRVINVFIPYYFYIVNERFACIFYLDILLNSRREGGGDIGV